MSLPYLSVTDKTAQGEEKEEGKGSNGIVHRMEGTSISRRTLMLLSTLPEINLPLVMVRQVTLPS